MLTENVPEQESPAVVTEILQQTAGKTCCINIAKYYTGVLFLWEILGIRFVI